MSPAASKVPSMSPELRLMWRRSWDGLGATSTMGDWGSQAMGVPQAITVIK